MKSGLFVTIFLLFILQLNAQTDLIINTHNRNVTSLNGTWKYIVDPYENGFYNYRYQAFDSYKTPSKSAFFTNSKPQTRQDLIEYDFDKSGDIQVPGDWNTQKEKLYYYEGTVWYKKSFDYNKSQTDNRIFIYFGAVNYHADIYLNGMKLGTHTGGFTPFNFEVTEMIKETDNFLVVKVDNKRHVEAVPTLNTDWWNYGGITRDVKIIETPATFIREYSIRLSNEDNKLLTGTVLIDGAKNASTEINIDIPELVVSTKIIADSNGSGEFEFRCEEIEYWSVNDPKLYDVTIKAGEDIISDKIGFRTIKTSGSKILLNDEEIFLKGISIHEESPITHGRANSPEDAEQLLGWVKELGGNYVRLAHYPHNEYMVKLADKMGILVWEEIPVYWTIAWENEGTYQNAENQLSEVITRDKNRASVIIWSMANETPASVARNMFLGKLVDHARKLDPTRLISAALEQRSIEGKPDTRTIDDPFAEHVDILSFNQYIGWYDGTPDKCERINWEITQNKPVIISEYGGGAKYGFYGDKNERWTEEYQEEIYKQNIKMLKRIKQLQGMSPWILVDFRSPRRVLPVIQDDYNRKGLISENGEKKKAFFILQEFYQNR